MYRLTIEEEDLLGLVQEARRFVTAYDESGNGRDPTSGAVIPLARASSGHWGPRRVELLSRHPAVQALIEAFLDYLRKEEPDVRVASQPTRVTITMPSGLRAGLGPRAGYFVLVTTRGENRMVCSVRSSSDFPKTLDWLRSLPPRQR